LSYKQTGLEVGRVMFFFFDVTRKEQQMSWFCFPLLTHAANAAAVLGLLTGRRRVFLSLNCLCRFLFCIPVYSVVKHPDQAVNQVEFFCFGCGCQRMSLVCFHSGTQIGTRITVDTGDVFYQQQQSR